MKARLAIFAAALALVSVASASFFGDLSNQMKSLTPQPAPAAQPNGQDTFNKISEAGKPISIEEETAIGESVALEVISQFGGLVRDRAICHRVNLVGRALARYSDRPDLDWHFGVLESDTVNALSAPGGFVFITRGLYNQAKTDDELAGILGHEITHITRKHALEAVKRGQTAAAWDAIGSQFFSKYREEKAKVQNVAAVAKQFDLDIGNIAHAMIFTGFDAPKEFDADHGGHDLAATTGYAPGGLRSVLIQLKAQGGDTKKLFPTHPALDDRIKRLPNEPARLAANP